MVRYMDIGHVDTGDAARRRRLAALQGAARAYARRHAPEGAHVLVPDPGAPAIGLCGTVARTVIVATLAAAVPTALAGLPHAALVAASLTVGSVVGREIERIVRRRGLRGCAWTVSTSEISHHVVRGAKAVTTTWSTGGRT